MGKSRFVQRFVPPVYVRIVIGIDACAESIQFLGGVACGQAVSAQCAVEGVCIRISVCKVGRAELGVDAEVIIHFHFQSVACAAFGRNQYHTVSTAHPIEGGSSGIFQYVARFDFHRTDVGDVTRETVD